MRRERIGVAFQGQGTDLLRERVEVPCRTTAGVEELNGNAERGGLPQTDALVNDGVEHRGPEARLRSDEQVACDTKQKKQSSKSDRIFWYQ